MTSTPSKQVERMLTGIGQPKEDNTMTMQIVNNRGVIYSRFSRQTEGEKLERQKEMCRAIANKQSIDVVAEIEDMGSGMKWERPGLKELVRLVEEESIRHVIVQAKDRLARSTDVNNRLTVLFRRQTSRFTLLDASLRTTALKIIWSTKGCWTMNRQP